MSALNIFLYEFKHFRKSKAKVFAYILFVLGCIYAIYNGISLQNKQNDTIAQIELKEQEAIDEMKSWYAEGKKGPDERPWVDITKPSWSLRSTSTYTIKHPSALLALGIGQAEQYGFYKQVTNWSSTYDNDMVEEIANPERLVNGNIDFAFLVIFLLPILLIIFTYNIKGLEKDYNFDRLITIQSGSIHRWVRIRFLFYALLLLLTVVMFILIVSFMNNGFSQFSKEIGSLLLLTTVYLLLWSSIYYFIIIKSNSSSAQAFKMISVWLVLCILIPGAVHQFASTKYPANYMIDFLDASREEAYKVYDLEPATIALRIKAIYPELAQTKQGKDTTDPKVVRSTTSAVINHMNKNAINMIEQQNDAKNKLITATYWFNPISYFQNQWNSGTSTDYNAYKAYRKNVQEAIDKRIQLLVTECWNEKKVDQARYNDYLKVLK